VNPFSFVKTTDINSAIATVTNDQMATFIGGGTALLDMMKDYVERHDRLVDINRLPFSEIEVTENGVRIGALVRNSQLATHAVIQERYPALSQTIERATHAAALIKIEYEEEPAIATFAAALAQNEATTPQPLSSCLPKAFRSPTKEKPLAPHDIIGERPDYSRGDIEQGFTAADVVLDLTYTTPVHHHPLVNETGTKSVGEIAKVGVIAAIANAIYHATDKRIRDLPITSDKLMST
jgi:FAD binding domain in molybdopterin dehydrogenase